MRARAALASAFAAAALLLLLVDGGACAMYKVGDLDAWGVPPASKPDVYKEWAKSIHFKLGDAIWFLYPPTQDSVLQVTPDAFHTCDLSSSPLLKLDDGNSIFNLTKSGRVYFISGEPKRCLKGQKLWVDVPKADGTLVQPSANDLAALAPTPGELPAGTVSAAPPDGARSADASDEAHPSAALRAVAGAGSVVAAAALAALLPLLL